LLNDNPRAGSAITLPFFNQFIMRLNIVEYNKRIFSLQMNYPAAPLSGIAASLGQATGYPAENYHRPKGRGIKPSSAEGGLNPHSK